MNPATKGINYYHSYNTKGTTMTSILKGYEDWTEAELPSSPECEYPTMRLIMERQASNGQWYGVHTQYFTPPKPKPTLPDVKPGAVVRYVDKEGRTCRAVKLDGAREDPWKVFTSYTCRVGLTSQTDEETLNDVNADGFTVELDGL